MSETIETRVKLLEMQMQDVRESIKWSTRSTVTTAIATCGILLGIIFQVLHR